MSVETPSSRTLSLSSLRMLTAVLAVCIFSSHANALKGDANGDGVVNVHDSRLVADYLVGNVLSIPRPEDADVSGDGQITTADALLILQFAKGLRTTFDFQSPLVLTVLPAANAMDVLLTSNISVFFSEPVSAASLSGAVTLRNVATGILIPSRIESSQEGVIVTVFPDQPLSPLTNYRIDVTTGVNDNEDNPLQQPFSTTFQTQALGSGVLVSTNNLSAPINALAPQPVVFKALNSVGAPVKQAAVTFTARMGSGNFEPSGKRQITVLTDDNGIAQAAFRLGGEAVVHTVEVGAIGFSTVPLFTVQALPLTPENLRIYGGNNQSGAPGGTAPLPLIVQATDAGGNPIAGTMVTFSVLQGQGDFAGQPTASVPTDSSGTAAAFFTFGASSGTVEVQATFQEMIGQAPTFTLLDLIPQPSSPTLIVGKVIDAQTQLPLQNVYVYLADTPTTWDWTDEGGFFRLTTTPGPHTVDVDGFESGVIGGFLYPVVAIPVNAVQGRENDVGMPVLLPRMDVESYIDVSGTQGGTLTLRSNPLWKMYVAPGQAHFANGTNTGRLYVAAVPADRIPMPVAGGKSSRFFDTIQPLNVTFNPPAQVSFPNADNLPPGTVTDIFTLSYSSGTFIRTGRGQVAEDGVIINSLSGEGITQGGWHNAPSPKPSPTACIKALLNLGRHAIAATMTSHGLSTNGKKIAADLWAFLLCNLPSDQGPTSPIINITNSSGSGGGGGGGSGGAPSVGGGGGGSGPGGGNPQPPFDGGPKNPPDPNDPAVVAISLSLIDQRLSIGEHTGVIIQLTPAPGTSASNIPVTLTLQTSNVAEFPRQAGNSTTIAVPSNGTLTLVVKSRGIGQTQIVATAGEVQSNAVTLSVVPKVLFKDSTLDTAYSPVAFTRRTESAKLPAQIAINTSGTGQQRTANAAFTPDTPEAASGTDFSLAAPDPSIAFSPAEASASPQPFIFTGSGSSDFSFNLLDARFSRIVPGDTTPSTSLVIVLFGPRTINVAFHRVNGIGPTDVSSLLAQINQIWNQANITFQAVGSVNNVVVPGLTDPIIPSMRPISGQQKLIVDSSNRPATADINVYFVNHLARPGSADIILGNATGDSAGVESVFISVGNGGSNSQTLAHEFGHSFGVGHLGQTGNMLMHESMDTNPGTLNTAIPPGTGSEARRKTVFPKP